MEYILTEEEYLNLKKDAEYGKTFPNKEELQKFCTMVADNLPVVPVKNGLEPWRCILTLRDDSDWYCDQCPAQNLCPHQYKNWSQ